MKLNNEKSTCEYNKNEGRDARKYTQCGEPAKYVLKCKGQPIAYYCKKHIKVVNLG